jgi:hypothetical protein
LGEKKKFIKFYDSAKFTFRDKEIAFAHVVDTTVELNNVKEYCCVVSEALIDLLDKLGLA